MKIDALEYRIGTLEAFLDFDFTAPANNGSPDCIHDLIADGMTGVTVDCEILIAGLMAEIQVLQTRLDALESKAPR